MNGPIHADLRAAIAFQAIRHLAGRQHVERLGVGIAVVAFSLVVNLIVSAVIARTARRTASPALEGDAAHLNERGRGRLRDEGPAHGRDHDAIPRARRVPRWR